MMTVIAMMVHGAAKETMLRHMPYWKALHQPMIICTPEDNPITLPGINQVFHPGKQQHSGMVALERQKRVMEMLRGLPGYDWYMVTEYDTLYLGVDLPPFERGLSGIRNPNDKPGERFKSRWVLGPPWVMDHDSLCKILQYADQHPEVTEEGCIDRFLPVWAEEAGVPVIQLPHAGLFMNEITPSDYDRMVKICNEGGRFYHGIKTKQCLDLLLNAYESEHC